MKLFYLFVLLFLAFMDFCEARDPKCLQPADPGICYGHVPMYAFKKDSQKCEQFIYGGCMGNDNRFATLEDCQKAC